MPQQGNSWVVEGGDNVFSIAQKVFGNQRMAMEILRMNGGQTLIRPGDVLSLPDWNDPNLYIGANEFQGVLNQNAQNPTYKGPTVAAVPDSQAGGLPSLTGQGQGPTGSTAVQGPNIPNNPYATQRNFREADVASMTLQFSPGYKNPSQPFGTNLPISTAKSGNMFTTVPPSGRTQQGRRDKGVSVQQSTKPSQTPPSLSTNPLMMAGGNIGGLIAAGAKTQPGSQAGKKPTTTTTGEHQKAFATEVENFKNYVNFGTSSPPPYVSGAAASAVLGYQYAKIMQSTGYVYDPQTRRFVYTNTTPTSTDKSGLPPAPTSFQSWGEDWNQSHYPRAQFEYAGLDRGGGGTGGGVTGRAGNTVGYAALSTRVATG